MGFKVRDRMVGRLNGDRRGEMGVSVEVSIPRDWAGGVGDV